MERNFDGAAYSSQIAAGLDKAYGNAAHVPIDASVDRLVIFSDQHRGVGDKSDDFKGCSKSYAGALRHYLEKDFSLVVLGDVEDLWKYSPKEVRNGSDASLAQEGLFHERKRYYRVLGNHDDRWADKDFFRAQMSGYFPGLEPVASLCLSLRQGGNDLGEIFLAHGHQGTSDSDRYSGISRWFVRHVYRPFQELTGYRTSTPSNDFSLRDAHSKAMYEWSEAKNRANPSRKLLFIAGHTHMPVFLSLNHVERLVLERESLRDPARFRPRFPQVAASARKRNLEQIETELGYRQERLNIERMPEASEINQRIPSYFNTGCCSFSDGDITGIELEQGEIRLVRWECRSKGPQRNVLGTATLLHEVFSQL